MVRIIGGACRSRRIRFAGPRTLRPTPDRVRETLFNWLAPRIRGARCLDLFAGSGALGFEAASRGAAAVTMVEIDPDACTCLEQNRRLLELDNITIYRDSAFAFLRRCEEIFDIVFVDPPFDAGAAGPALAILLERGRISGDGVVYLEQRARDHPHDDIPGWVTIRRQRAGEVDFRLLAPADSPAMVLR